MLKPKTFEKDSLKKQEKKLTSVAPIVVVTLTNTKVFIQEFDFDR